MPDAAVIVQAPASTQSDPLRRSSEREVASAKVARWSNEPRYSLRLYRVRCSVGSQLVSVCSGNELLRSGSGQRHDEARPAIVGELRFETAIMQLHELLADVESHAQAGLIVSRSATRLARGIILLRSGGVSLKSGAVVVSNACTPLTPAARKMHAGALTAFSSMGLGRAPSAPFSRMFVPLCLCALTADDELDRAADERCVNGAGTLVPLSDYGHGAAVVFKAWVCTNPECRFNLKIRPGDVARSEPVIDGATGRPLPPARGRRARRMRNPRHHRRA